MDKMEKTSTFEKELTCLINKYSKENDSNTPDFMLAEYVIGCLSNFSVTMYKRDKWYKDSSPIVSKVKRFIKHSINRVL